MNKFFFFFLLCTGMVCSAQNVQLQYDAAGNQVQRSICFCKMADPILKDIIEPKNEDFQKDIPTDLVSYYPNPVKEQLYLKWNLAENKKVTSVEVYNLNGQKLYTMENLTEKENCIVDFYSYPSGNYLVVITYTDSDKKTLNIIKN